MAKNIWSCSKQCGRDIIPQINNVINIKNLCDLIEKYDIVLIAYENEKENTLKEQLKMVKEKMIVNQNNSKLRIGVVIRTWRRIGTSRC